MIKRFFITKDLDVLEFEVVNEWGYHRHSHNFFELTFILKGSGHHLLNDSIVEYKEGDLFFLTPKDEHEFVVAEPSMFGIIKFTEQLFLEKSSFTSSTYWRKNLETVIFHSNVIAESIICCKNDNIQLFGLYQLIKNELNNNQVYSSNVLSELFGALLIVLSRNLKSCVNNNIPTNSSDAEKTERLLTYIRQNLLNKDLINIKTIASEFNMSPNYVGTFIKKNAGISFKQYVMQTKMKMAEKLLKQSNLNINQIVEKLDFTDASHFNRVFKKYHGVNPSKFS
jgi:YesN/AraC family two-component response regulator